MIRRVAQLGVGSGERGVDHRQFVRVGADRLQPRVHRVLDVGGADEGVAEALLQSLDAPALPEEAMPAAGAEIGDAQRPLALQDAQPLDLAPELRLGAGVEHVEIEAAHAAHGGAGAQLVDDRKRGDFPHGRLAPETLEAELVLAVATGQLVRRQAKSLQPFHERRLENLLRAVEGVAGEPDQLVLGEPQGSGVVELVDEFTLFDDVGEAHRGCAVDELERHLAVAVQPPDHLQHQDFVEIGVEQRAHDGVDAERVVVDAGREIGDHVLHVRRGGFGGKGGGLAAALRSQLGFCAR